MAPVFTIELKVTKFDWQRVKGHKVLTRLDSWWRDKRTYARLEVRSSTLGSWKWHDRARDQKSKLALAQAQGVRQCSQGEVEVD